MHSHKNKTPFQIVIHQHNYNNLMKLPRIKYSTFDDFVYDNSTCFAYTLRTIPPHSHLQPQFPAPIK